MPRRRSNLGRRTRGAEAVRRVIANQTEEERASANERNRQRMAQIRAEEAAERRAARLEDARLRARRSREIKHIRNEAMAEASTVSKSLLAEQLLKTVPDCNGLDVSLPREHLPTCKSEPNYVEEESPTALPRVCPSTHGKGKESPINNAIYSLGANQCFHCLITFPDEKFKERHMKREHPEDFVQANLRDALFVCFICNKAFESSRALICHQRGHASAPPSDCLHPLFDCSDCGRRFGQLANYQRHRLGHAAGHSLPHQCPDCGKSFRQLSNLRRHQAFHQQTQELLPSRPYSCMECGESFNQEAGLHEHYIRHARGEL